uniref:16S rRNA (cytosine(967)-C(5))-methyltransferase n=1 Tax=Desulfomonile tiedjei TaxID=2358 RepID=A0A7C4ASS8_9BACT
MAVHVDRSQRPLLDARLWSRAAIVRTIAITDRTDTKKGSKTTEKVSQARDIALRVLMRVEKGAFAERELDQALRAQSMTAKDRSLATELVYGVLRWKFRLDDLMEEHTRARHGKMDTRLRQILRIALYQYLFLSRVPSHALVNEAVNQARAVLDDKRASFVNAILRAILAQQSGKGPCGSSDATSLARYYSHPLWLVQRWLRQYGPEATRRILEANNAPAPLMCRVNALKTTVRDLFACLEKEGADFEPSVIPGAFQLNTHGRSLRDLPSYQRGLFTVQDIASQMVPPLLQVEPGMRVLDACAAPGGKTALLAALGKNSVHITAVDVSAPRLEAARQNLQRLGVKNVQHRQGDLADKAFAAALGSYDRILVDAPCSGMGVLRRNPEARYRTREEDLQAFADRQIGIVLALAPLLKPGGKMVYSVCTVTREETQDVAAAVLTGCSFLRIDPIEASELPDAPYFLGRDGCLETFPAAGDLLVDGFFAVRMMREKKCE